MARPIKEGLDYFPVDVDFDEKVESIIMMHEHGLTWIIRFWQKAYKTMAGLVDFRELFGELFTNKCRITTEEHHKILQTALKVGFCHEVEPGIYTSNGIQKRIAVVSKERSEAIKRQKNNKKKQKKSKVKKCPDYSPPYSPNNYFEQFWLKYPKKRGKGYALKAWKKIKNPAETIQKILTTLEWQIKSHDWIKEKGKYIPNPATYLNGKCWEDEQTSLDLNPKPSNNHPDISIIKSKLVKQLGPDYNYPENEDYESWMLLYDTHFG